MISEVHALDLAYNPRLQVDDPNIRFEVWKAQSDRAKRHGRWELDLSYGEHPREVYDLALPQAEMLGCAIFFHGGYWRALDKDYFGYLAEAYRKEGIGLALVQYRLLPDAHLRDIVSSAEAATRVIAQRFPAANLALMGHSAGAHLAAMAARTLAVGSRLKALLLVSGLYELQPLREVPFIREFLHLQDDETEALSPARKSSAGIPFMTILGGSEPSGFAEQTKLLETNWAHDFHTRFTVHEGNHFDSCNAIAHSESVAFVREAISGRLESPV